MFKKSSMWHSAVLFMLASFVTMPCITYAANRAAILIGACSGKGNWRSANAIIGPLQTHRLFYSGSLPLTFEADDTPTTVTIIASYKTATTNVKNYVKSVPANRQVILAYHHEPEGDYSSGAVFVSEFKTQSDLIRSCANSNVRIAMISASYPYGVSGNTDVQDGNYLKDLGNYVDLFGVDIYQGVAGTEPYCWPTQGLRNYPRWNNWLNVVTDPAIVGTIKPLGITEYGVDDPVGDERRNQRIQLDRDYLIEAFTPGSAKAISPYRLQVWSYWWRSVDQNAAKFTDAPTIATWRGIENAAYIAPRSSVTHFLPY